MLFFSSDCLEHADHLIVKGGLAIIDHHLKAADLPFRYYSSLAKTAHVCREGAKDLFKIWCSLHGDESALQHALTLVPTCCASRWGSVEGVEKRLNTMGEHNLVPVVKQMLITKKRTRSEVPHPIVDDPSLADSALPNSSGGGTVGQLSSTPVNHIAIEQMEAYSKMMGRWRVDTLLALENQLWWRLLDICPRARCGCNHLSAFLKSQLSEKTLDTKGAHLAQLVTGKALAIQEEFNNAITDDYWAYALCATDGDGGDDGIDFEWLTR